MIGRRKISNRKHEGGAGGEQVHVGGELAQRFVEVVHLGQDTHHNHNGEDVCGWMSKLVFAAKREFQSNAEAFDSHDGDGADGRANADVNHGIFLPINRGDLIDHDHCEKRDDGDIDQEGCTHAKCQSLHSLLAAEPPKKGSL